MFKNWFKSEKSEIVEQSMSLVQKIHQDFKTKGDLLVIEANNILKEATFNELKTKKELLHECGFTNTKITKEINILEDKIENSKIIQKFNNKLLGQYKVINLNQIQEICGKYKLCMSRSNNYNSEVPIKNLKEIKDFLYNYKSQIGSLDKQNMCIVAPEKDFNSKTDFYIKENLKIKMEDPIVLFPCNDRLVINRWTYEIDNQYFYIVTAWGDEVSDELVVNNKMN